MQPKDEPTDVSISATRKDSGAGASTDAAGDDDLSTLVLPSQQTAAVAAAKKAGRPLVSEVSGEAPEDGPRPPGESERRRSKRTR